MRCRKFETRSLSLFFLILISGHLVSSLKPFVCDSETKGKKLKNTNIERLMINKDIVYIFFGNQIISFKIPFLSLQKNGLVYFLNRPFFREDNEINKYPDIPIESGANFIGHSVSFKKSLTYELYKNNKTSFKTVELSFSNRPAQRIKIDYIPEVENESNSIFIFSDLDNELDFRYFNGVRNTLVITKLNNTMVMSGFDIGNNQIIFNHFYFY